MAKTKNTSVEIIVYKYVSKKLFDILQEYLDNLSENIEDVKVDLELDFQKENDVWNKEQANFSLLDSIPYILAIKEIWVPSEQRKQGIGSAILSIITSVFGKESLIFAYGSMLEREYPALKYSTKEEHDGRIVVNKEEIVRGQLEFLNKRGFLEVSAYTNANMDRSIMLFGGPIGHIAKEYMECHIVTLGRHAHNRVNRIYRELFYHTLSFVEDENAIMYPWLLNEEQRINPKLDDTQADIEKLRDQPWYSGYDGERSDISSCAAMNRSVLTLIGGAEVEVTNLANAIWVGYNCLFLAVKDNVKYISHDYSHLCYNEETDKYDFDKLTDEDKKAVEFPNEDFQDNENTNYVLMRGYGLFSDGIWRERLWYYDTVNNEIVEEVETVVNVEFPLAYVGYICQVHSEL